MISYAKTDLSSVLEVVSDLERAHEEVWVDQDLAGGQVWWNTILERIRQCDVLLVALSPSYLGSRACRSELDYAAQLGRIILPVMVKDVAVQLAPPVIANAQIIDYRTRSIVSAIALVSAVKSQVGAPPLPSPLPDPPDPPISYMSDFNERVDAYSLSFTDQIHLIAELKAFLGHPADRAVAAQLLRRLRRRTDITESVGREIDQLLITLPQTDTRTAGAAAPGNGGADDTGVAPPADGTGVAPPADGTGVVPSVKGPAVVPSANAVLPSADEAHDMASADGDQVGLRSERGIAPPVDQKRRRWRMVVLGAAAVVIVVAVTVLAARLGNPSDSATAGGVFPASAPLTPSQLIVSMETGNTWALFVADTTSPSPGVRLTPGDNKAFGPVVSPDRRTVLYWSEDRKTKRQTLRVAGAADLSGDRELFQLPAGCDETRRPAWNTTRQTMIALLCVSNDKQKDKKYVLRIMGSAGDVMGEVSPPDGMPRMGDPTFSADGARLAFWAGPVKGPDGGTLYDVSTADVIAGAGGHPHPLLEPGDAHPQDRDPVFSPNGKYVAFVRVSTEGTSAGHARLFRATSEGGNVKTLTGDTKYDYVNPSWSPGSDRIAYSSNEPAADLPGCRKTEACRVWIMRSNGTEPGVLLENEARNGQGAPAWTAR